MSDFENKGDFIQQQSLSELDKYISACQQSYSKCIDHIDVSLDVSGLDATLRFHYLKFDGNGIPMVDTLAEYLYQHIIDYCLASRSRSASLTTKQSARLTKEARKLFVHPCATEDDPDQTGEAGEILLYFLMESVLRAPQVVAKMEFKTNHNDEVKGSDGIHMRWNAEERIVEVLFGESKLHQSISSALSSAFKSIESFHAENMRQHEFLLVTKHFKYADHNVSSAVLDLLDSGVPGGGVKIVHACLIGYNWDVYKKLSSRTKDKITEEFVARYKSDAGRLHQLIQKRFDAFKRKHLAFEVFFLPFRSVQEFRDAFNAALD